MLGPAYNEHFYAQKCARSSSMRGCSRVLVVTELVSGTERTSLSYYPHKILYISLNNNKNEHINTLGVNI